MEESVITVYTATTELRATPAQLQYLGILHRSMQDKMLSPQCTFPLIRSGLGILLLRELKRMGLLIFGRDKWGTERMVLAVEKFDDMDFAFDSSEFPDVGVRTIKPRIFYVPFFERLHERITGSYVPSARREAASCGLSVHEVWGL